jgi:uncharacterized protein (TIGR04222 family)
LLGEQAVSDFDLLNFLDLRGPEFLLFYGLVAICVVAASALAVSAADRTSVRQLPKVPSAPDPIEVAYLKGGSNHALRTAVYDLRQRGLLALDGDRLKPTGAAPPPGGLGPLFERVLYAVQAGPKISQLFSGRGLRGDVKRILEPLRAKLAAEEMLRPAAVGYAAAVILAVALALLVSLAWTKVEIGERLGKPVGFLIALAMIAVLLEVVIVVGLASRAASRRGRAYLESIRTAYSSRLRTAAAGLGGVAQPLGVTGAAGTSLLLLVGLDGFSALKNTPDAAFAKAFAKSNSDGGGGSCGSSCSGGGGDGGGGGCGGCGGGGD